MRSFTYLLLLLTVATACQTVANQDNESVSTDPRVSGIDSLAMAFFDETGYPGLVVSVGLKGELFYSRGFGYADVEQQVVADPAKSKFRVGSVAKAFTSDASYIATSGMPIPACCAWR